MSSLLWRVLLWPEAHEVKIKADNANVVLIKNTLSAFDVGRSQLLLLVGIMNDGGI